MGLTKADIVDTIHEKVGNKFPISNRYIDLRRIKRLTKIQCQNAVDHLIELMRKRLEAGEDILISGFGKFCIKKKKKRIGRNPATGKEIILSKRKIVTFKCSGKLRSEINK